MSSQDLQVALTPAVMSQISAAREGNRGGSGDSRAAVKFWGSARMCLVLTDENCSLTEFHRIIPSSLSAVKHTV